MRRRKNEQVASVTAAPRGLRADVRSREAKYLFSMGIRTACFIGAFFAGGPLRWILVAAAFFLPYFAVVLANAGRDRAAGRLSPYIPPRHDELPPGSDESNGVTGQPEGSGQQVPQGDRPTPESGETDGVGRHADPPSAAPPGEQSGGQAGGQTVHPQDHRAA